MPGIPHSQTPNIYRTHKIFVNTSPSGMLDKTIFEAAASGCIVLAASADFADFAGSGSCFYSIAELADLLKKSCASTAPISSQSVREHSLSSLSSALIKAMQL